MPGTLVVQSVDRMLERQYHLQRADRQDAIAEALLECVRARAYAPMNMAGFFVVVARRRACDFWRRRQRQGADKMRCSQADAGSNQNEITVLLDVANRFFASRPALERHRGQVVVREVLEGATFTEACRSAGIPRGSQGRYRSLLQQCFGKALHVRLPPGPA